MRVKHFSRDKRVEFPEDPIWYLAFYGLRARVARAENPHLLVEYPTIRQSLLGSVEEQGYASPTSTFAQTSSVVHRFTPRVTAGRSSRRSRSRWGRSNRSRYGRHSFRRSLRGRPVIGGEPQRRREFRPIAFFASTSKTPGSRQATERASDFCDAMYSGTAFDASAAWIPKVENEFQTPHPSASTELLLLGPQTAFFARPRFSSLWTKS